MSSGSTGIRRTARRQGRHAVRAAARVLDRLSPPDRGVVILAYHQVGGPLAGSVNLSPGLFDEQMAMLADGGDTGPVVSLDDAVRALNGNRDGESRERNRVAITFDDGTADFVEQAVPILEKHGLPATLYLATDFVERERSFWDDGTSLSWAALRDVIAGGSISIGSHTHTHALLDRVSPASVIDELERSVGLIGERLGVEARHFAYPKALAPAPGSGNDQEVRRLMTTAAVAGGRVNPYTGADLHRLGRTPVLVEDGLRWFARKAAGGLRFEGTVRERIDHRRYDGATR